jgi:hypothetical protein
VKKNGVTSSVAGTMCAEGTQAGIKKRKARTKVRDDKVTVSKKKCARLKAQGYDASNHPGVKQVQDQLGAHAKSMRRHRDTRQVSV